jgi:hypothetical protein
MFGPTRDVVTQEWRKLHNEDLNDLYSYPTIMLVIKSRMRWTEHVAGMGREEPCTGFWRGNLRERDHLVDPGVDWRIILRRIFWKLDWGYGMD